MPGDLGAALIVWGSITGSGLGSLAGWDYRGVVISVVYLLVRRLLGCLMVLTRRHMSRDAELLVLHYNTARPHRSLGQLTPAQADSHPPLWASSPTSWPSTGVLAACMWRQKAAGSRSSSATASG